MNRSSSETTTKPTFTRTLSTPLRFAARHQSLLIAFVMAAALAVWLASGETVRVPDASVDSSKPPAPVRQVRVRVRTLTAEPVAREIVVSGRTEPARAATLRAEADGRVVAVGPGKGERVKQGDVIVRLDAGNLEARLADAQAALDQRRLNFEATKRLERKSFQSELAAAEARTALEAARATLKLVEVHRHKLEVHAPFDGVLERRELEMGEYAQDGTEVARVLELAPVLVTADVNQQDRDLLSVGMKGQARLVSGEVVEGRLRYISAEADPATRTFRVELEVDNDDYEVVAGLSAELQLELDDVSGHAMSPALLSLNPSNGIGVKAVNEDDVVEFHGVEVVRATNSGIWVDGLPEVVRVITVGQGFVNTGDRVEAVEEEPAMDVPVAAVEGAQ